MAQVNGFSPDDDTVAVVTSHLGKRKRTVSPEPNPAREKQTDSSLQSALQSILQVFRENDTTPSLLKHPLHTPVVDSPDTKRTRLNAKDSGDSIESRILAGSYSSLDSLTKDVKIVQAAILEKLSDSTVNGDEQHHVSRHPDTKDKLSNLVQLLEIFTQQPSKLVNGKAVEAVEDELSNQDNSSGRVGQILSLRTQINGRPHFLYSGLASDQTAESASLDSTPKIKDTGLPNGLEVTDFALLKAARTSGKIMKRKFGDVFHSNHIGTMSRKFDPPKATGLRTNTLRFSNRPRYWDQNPNPGDYKDTKLETGSWLSYGSNSSIYQSKKTGGDLQPANGIPNESLWTPSGTDDLFTSAYSSFAPASDNSLSIPSLRERGQAWWREHGNERLSTIFSADEGPGQSLRESSEKGEESSDVDEFADLVAEFTSMEDEDLAETTEEASDIDTVLQELSELIEILASHQKARALNPPSTFSSPTQPSEVEIGVYEMLRGQLSILVGTLPPYAVAKLNGDQLEKLNISTKMPVEVPVYAGTGQVDDFVLKRQRASVAATSAASRSGAASLPRQGYTQGQTVTSPYNGHTRNYNPSIPASAGYGARNTTNYQTPTAPRPGFNQTPYQAQTVPYSNRPTIQQFQRPIQQNGYVSNANGPPASYAQAQTPGFAQRPSQPGYQQRAQQGAITSAGRSASPQKPLTNGQIYPARGAPSNQYLFPRQASGTPSTPAAVVQGPNSDASGHNIPVAMAKTPQQSLSPGVNLSQTVEVSR
ncbi:hypothetical protein B0A52_00674 [Exophiala mesophila]|uniref:Uncharacterized protein n=1 Tax=Exophiala mesophila TaxID=212818 RepID=A0A438NHX5_EXOME|nr:hypothetical protein B0A52_00674 [Exophiala mesophila]